MHLTDNDACVYSKPTLEKYLLRTHSYGEVNDLFYLQMMKFEQYFVALKLHYSNQSFM